MIWINAGWFMKLGQCVYAIKGYIYLCLSAWTSAPMWRISIIWDAIINIIYGVKSYCCKKGDFNILHGLFGSKCTPTPTQTYIGLYVLKVVLHYTHLCQHQLQPWLYKLSNHVYKAVDNRCHQNTKIASTDLDIAAMTGENRCCRLL